MGIVRKRKTNKETQRTALQPCRSFHSQFNDKNKTVWKISTSPKFFKGKKETKKKKNTQKVKIIWEKDNYTDTLCYYFHQPEP